MSISRKNWSALSSLARQWTMEDEEEVERERRRRVKSSSGADPDSDVDHASRASPPAGTDPTSETSQSLSSVEQIQMDFVEMLRVRDEKRRMRHVETLRRQKEEGDDEGANGGGGARVELLGDVNEERGGEAPPARAASGPQPPRTASSSHSGSGAGTNGIPHRQAEGSESLGKSPNPSPPVNPARKFVSSVSISLDKGSPSSGRSAPMSPLSPAGPASPPPPWSPCQSPPPRGAKSPAHNGYAQQTSDSVFSPGGTSEQTTKPFIRQSSRTLSFRMMKKKEEESSPLQRSASVRMATKKFESNTNENEESPGSFQRNSRQRISSRSIQEKMERLAQAAQKSEVTRSPDVTQRTLFLMEEVSRKRGLFEKDQQTAASSSPGVSRQEFRNFASGMSDRISRWLNKTNPTGSLHTSADLRHVDIGSKRSLFEATADASASKSSQTK
ncbi:ladinin-1 [Betta splendens]|uniref:Ladinin-1 n=1 Tax=Betta splendens TaxID=158456 RepID=A0A6P7MXM3_BETSP|nr:ladinin-1 [Betta splendens]